MKPGMLDLHVTRRCLLIFHVWNFANLYEIDTADDAV